MPHDDRDVPRLGARHAGIRGPKMAKEPLATAGEATPGPDDVDPYEEVEQRRQQRELDRLIDELDGSRPTVGTTDTQPAPDPFEEIEPSLPEF